MHVSTKQRPLDKAPTANANSFPRPASLLPSTHGAPHTHRLWRSSMANIRNIISATASEVTEIRSAVVAVKKALEAIQANADPAAGAMLKLNLREARDMLARRLAEVSANTAGDAKLAAAEREASILLGDVDAQFFSL